MYTGFWEANLRARDCLKELGVDGRIILRWIFGKWDVRAWTTIWLRTDRWQALEDAVMIFGFH